jgi:predicted ribosomally synthesized peptide with SipW-like signal peptide
MKKILFSIIAVVVCVAAMGSAFAYFTDVETSEANVLGAGTLDIQIADNNQGYRDTPVSASFTSPADWAPGQEFTTGIVYLKNVGTIDIRWIFARFTNLNESAVDFSKKILLKSIYESNNGGTSFTQSTFDTATANIFLNYWIGRGADTKGMTADGSISLKDLYIAREYGSGDYSTSLLLLNNAPFPNPALPVGSTAAFKFTFQLDPTTNNVFQGATAAFDVFFIANQQYVSPDVDYPDTLLRDYITEEID